MKITIEGLGTSQDIAKNLRGIQHSLNLLLAFALEKGNAEGLNPAIDDLVVLNSLAEVLEEKNN
jgi:hypothetical protein